MANRQSRRTKNWIRRRRRIVARLYAGHMTQEEIAEALGKPTEEGGMGRKIQQSTVSRDIKAIEQQWAEESRVVISEMKARELAELREMERRCAVEAARPNNTSTQKRNWIETWLKVKVRIAAMMGLDGPQSLTITRDINADEKTLKELAKTWEKALEQRVVAHAGRSDNGQEHSPI